MPFFTSSSGDKIAYKTAGDPKNASIIFAHGWLHNKHLWDETIDILQDSYYCVALDFLGHGESASPPNGDYSIQAQAQRIIDLADRLEIKRFVLVGFSMAGAIGAYLVAELAPQRILKWVSISGIVDGTWTLTTKLRLPLFEIAQYMPWSFALARHLFRWKPTAYLLFGFSNFYSYTDVDPKYWRDVPMENFIPDHAIGFQRQIKWLSTYNVLDVADKITVPTLIIAAVYDKVIPIEKSLLLADKIAHAQIKEIDHCGHMVMGEKFEVYIKALQTFLRE